MKRLPWICISTAFLSGCSMSFAQVNAPINLNVSSATFVRAGEPAQLATAKDRFGPGLDSTDLNGSMPFRTELRFPCTGVPEGDYYPGLLILLYPWNGYLGAAEAYWQPLHLYLNDTRLLWTGHAEPRRPEYAAETNFYQAELRRDQPVHIRHGDVLRVVFAQDHSGVTIGPIRLYRMPPKEEVVKFGLLPDWGKPNAYWLAAKWEEPQREGDTVRQPCLLRNPGVLPRKFSLEVVAKDYLQKVALSKHEEVVLRPGEKRTHAFGFKLNPNRWSRLTVTATSAGVFPPVRLVKFYVNDLARGPRPNTCLNGEWEMCYAPGVEPGSAPLATAEWKKIAVPSLQPTDKGHCAWYRKSFDAPAYVQGERVVLKCGQVLSEAWFYLNGQPVGHEFHGSLPFEVDLTAAFKPGERNELLVAVRDWLAYSPKNRDRVTRGETPIYKDNMIDVAEYTATSQLGIGQSVWLEARPAVSVEDVFVVTSVRRKRLALHYRLINTGKTDQNVMLLPSILDEG